MAFRYGPYYPLQRLWWHVAGLWAHWMLSGEKVVYHRVSERIKGPAIVVGNHASLTDWFLAWQVLRRPILTAAVARYFISDSFKAFWLRHAGAIPNSVFAADNASAIAMMRALKKNGILLLYPEAHTGSLSRREPFPEATSKFIRRIGVPVWSVRVDGASLCYPKWGKKRTGGLIEVSAKQLFTREDLKEMTAEEVHRTITEAIGYDDFAFLEKHPELHFKTKGNPARRLELNAWRCPVCGKTGTLRTEGDRVFCSCGYSAHVDDRYNLSSGPCPTTQALIASSVENIKKDIEDPAWTISSSVTLKLPTHKPDGGQREAGKGVCTLSHEGLAYKGWMDGKEAELAFPVGELVLLPYTTGKNFVVYRKDVCYIFCPDRGEDCARFSYATAALTGHI